jgi:hypothetical protein
MARHGTRTRPPRTFAHRAGEFVILNATIWTWLLFGMGRGIAIQLSIWACGSLGMLAWEYWANKRHERAFRSAHGLCASCGYDLRESALVCPECGAPVPVGHQTRSKTASDLEDVR